MPATPSAATCLMPGFGLPGWLYIVNAPMGLARHVLQRRDACISAGLWSVAEERRISCASHPGRRTSRIWRLFLKPAMRSMTSCSMPSTPPSSWAERPAYGHFWVSGLPREPVLLHELCADDEDPPAVCSAAVSAQT